MGHDEHPARLAPRGVLLFHRPAVAGRETFSVCSAAFQVDVTRRPYPTFSGSRAWTSERRSAYPRDAAIFRSRVDL